MCCYETRVLFGAMCGRGQTKQLLMPYPVDTGNPHLTLEEVAPQTWLVLSHTAFLLMHCKAW